jgi:hypothetical protein
MSIPLLLAQIGDWINPPVPPLPDPPLFQRFILEHPEFPALFLLVAAVIVLIVLRAQGRLGAGLLVLLGATVLAGGIWLTGTLVRTDREVLLERQDRLVHATAAADTDTLARFLSVDARVRSTRLAIVRAGIGRDEILAMVESTLGGPVRVSSVAVIERQGVIDGPNTARTQVHLRVQPESGNKTFAWFAIVWRLEPDGVWRVFEIEPLFISGVMPYQP